MFGFNGKGVASFNKRGTYNNGNNNGNNNANNNNGNNNEYRRCGI